MLYINSGPYISRYVGMSVRFGRVESILPELDVRSTGILPSPSMILPSQKSVQFYNEHPQPSGTD